MYQGVLCGECRDGKGVSVLLNNCVTCHSAQGLLILALSRLNFQSSTQFTPITSHNHAVVADAVAFLVIVFADVPLPGWVYPFLFYIQVM